MGAPDVAGTVRARALARRGIGTAAARRLAATPSLAVALDELADGPYGRYVRRGQTLAEAQTAVVRTLLWHVRVLAGWQSRMAAEPLRVLSGAFELSNLDELVHRIGRGAETGAPEPFVPFELGGLAMAWPRLRRAGTAAELRAALAHSSWGDPGAETGWATDVVPRLVWLRQVAARVPVAAQWAYGAALLFLAAQHLVLGRPITASVAEAWRPLVGVACLNATTLEELRADADHRAGWVLDDVTVTEDLWRAEVTWWRRVDGDGRAGLHAMRFSGATAVSCAAVLAADAWRVRAALAAAGGGPSEVFDALA